MKIPILHKSKGLYNMEIDDEDEEKLKGLNITLNHTSNRHTKYAKAVIYKNCKYVKTINIHRLIMGLGDYKNDKRVIHHIDGNGLNNKKENLLITTTLYNSQSINKHRCNVGCIYFEKNTEKTKRKKQWMFTITCNKKRHRKRFLTKEEAIKYKEGFIKDLLN
jgi:hypothetical protein